MKKRIHISLRKTTSRIIMIVSKIRKLFSKVKKLFSRKKELFSKVKKLFSREKELFSKVKELFSREKELFSKVKELFSREKELFSKVKKLFSRVKIVFFRIRKLFSNNTFLFYSRILVAALLIYCVYFCWTTYQEWNRVPSHQIEARLHAQGLLSNKSYCKLILKIMGGTLEQDQKHPKDNGNKIIINNSNDYTDSIATNLLYNGPCRNVYQKHKDSFKRMVTFYFLDYYTRTNIKNNITVYNNKEKDGAFHFDELTLDYIDNPVLTKDPEGIQTKGSGLLGYSKCDGGGDMSFYTSLLNSIPNIWSPWDITQANYSLIFTSNRIKCDLISIEFNGATHFSAMYPIPDKITMSGIQFVDSIKIETIQKEGLRFHTDFIQMKELSARRTFLLSACLSLLISIIANYLYRFLFDKKNKNTNS